MTPEELKQIEALIKKHKPSGDGVPLILTFLFLMFLSGCFKGCGY